MTLEIKLELPNIKYYESYINAMKEFQEYKNKVRYSDKKYDNFDLTISKKDFAEKIITTFLDIMKGVNLPSGYISATEFWIIDEDGYVGRMNLRHKLNERLEKIGGHIGYDIIPSKRNKGYASKALRLTLAEAKKIGLNEVLITCDEKNIASKKVILGVLNEYGGKEDLPNYEEESGSLILRYWINTSK